MATKIASKQLKFGILRQSPDASAATSYKASGSTDNQWTNPAGANQNFRTLYYTAGSPIPDPGVTVDEYNVTSQRGLNKELSNFYVDSHSGLAKLSFSGLADVKTLAPHLAGALQSVVEAPSTPYDKVFTSGFTAGTIDFAAGDGYLHTIAINQGASADDGTILKNAIIDTLNLTWDFNAKGVARLTQMNGTWVGNEMNFEQTLSGTWVTTTLTPFNSTADGSFYIDDFTVGSFDWKSMCIRRISLAMNNKVTSNCATTLGKPNQYDVNPDITWTIVFDHNSTTEKAMGSFQSGAAVHFRLLNELITENADGGLTIDTPYCRIVAPPMIYNGDFLGYSMQLRAYQSGTNTPITVSMVDAQDWGY